MIAVDYNQIAMTSVHASQALSQYTDVEQIRHIVLNMLRSINAKFGRKYGKIVLACDSKQSWRKVVFPPYKAHRKADRAKLAIDWPAVFELFASMKNELKEYTAWPIIEVTGAEGDDIIATLVSYNLYGPHLIISADGDFKQLQAWADVEQYDPIHGRFVTVDDAEDYLFEHIIRGDRGDGVPNILSDDDTFVNPAKRQGKVTDKRLIGWKETPMTQWLEEHQRNFSRNKRLIDLREIPPKLKEKIQQEYNDRVESIGEHRIYDYLVDYKLTNLLSYVSDFQ